MKKYTTPQSVSDLATTDPEFAQALANSPLPGPPALDIHGLRSFQIEAQKQMNARFKAHVDVQRTSLMIPMRDGHENEALVFRHSQPSTSSKSIGALVVLVFGGGFVTGSKDQLEYLSRNLCKLYSAVVVNISYRLAPEHKFPIPARDVWDNIKWLARNGASIGANTDAGFVVGGGSAGANLSAVAVQHAARTQLFPPISGSWSCIPFLLDAEIVPSKYTELYLSREQNASAPGLNAAMMQLVKDLYGPDPKSPDFSPFNDPASFSQLPRTYIQACGLDPVRDDGIIYAKTLFDHGVDCRLDVYPGVPHGFHGMFPDLRQARKFEIDSLVNIGWLLNVDIKRSAAEDLL